MNEEVRRFSLRKLSVGLASVLVGVSIFGASQTVKADTVANNQTSSVTSNAQSSDTQENKNVAKSSFSNDNQANNAQSNATQTQKNEQKQAQAKNIQQDSAPQTQEVNNSNNLQGKSAEKDIVSTNSLQESNNQSNTVTKKTVQHDTLENGQKAQSFNLPKNSQKFNRKVLATNLSEATSSPMTNGGFDEATWGKLDVNNWHGSVQDGVYQLTGYTGDEIHIIVPNEADFEQAGKSTNGLQVGITCDTVQSLLSRTYQRHTIAFSKTNDQKVKAIGTDWSHAFSESAITNFDGSNLDVSGVTNMSNMFGDRFLANEISDLSSLANWNTSKVTDMSNMFIKNKIRDLSPLVKWDVSNVTDMSDMFNDNQISDLTPLANWDVSKVTDMSRMFLYNRNISDLAPLANWDVSNVTDMSSMFHGNKIGDLSPLANWDVSNVTDMSDMFSYNSISDLTPLAKWDVSNVTDMSDMFNDNQISDLTPLANWDVSKVTDMSWMFKGNKISDLTPLANWDVSKVFDMNHMFAQNPDIKDLKPIANRDMRSVAIINLDGIFEGDTQLDLTDINNTQFMQDFLKIKEKAKDTSDPSALRYRWILRRILGNVLQGTTFVTNNADLVDVIVGQKLPVFTNTAKRTIVFNFPDGTSKTIVQIINYKTIAPVQIDWPIPSAGGGRAEMAMMAFVPNPVQSADPRIIKTYTIKDVKASDWQLDDSKQNDAIIVNGQIRFASVKIPHVNGYKAYIVPNKLNPALFTVSFMAVPTETKPSTPVEVTPSKPSASTAPTDHTSNPVEVAPSKPSAPTDRPSNSAWTNLDHKVVNALNQADSGWTMPADNSTYKAEVPTDDATIDLSDLVIAQPVHAQTRTQIHINKRFKLRKHGKKHAVKHFKHRKKVARQFRKYRL